MNLDIDKYSHHLDAFDLTEDQKTELQLIIWYMMESFADLGWGLDSTQICLGIVSGSDSKSQADSIESADGIIDEFQHAVHEGSTRERIP